MILDLVVEACDHVRCNDGVYVSVELVHDIATGVEVRRKRVESERVVAAVAGEPVVAYLQST